MQKTIKRLSKSEFSAMFNIMRQSFPLDEYRPENEQLALFNDGRYGVFALYSGQNLSEQKLSGFLSAWELDDFTYFEHFAVDSALRGGGLGSELLAEAVRLSHGGRVCLEVEPPYTDIAARRIRFYERNGFSLNDYAYWQPPISAGRHAIPLKIMTTHGKISKTEFENIRKTLYTEVYKIKEELLKWLY